MLYLCSRWLRPPAALCPLVFSPPAGMWFFMTVTYAGPREEISLNHKFSFRKDCPTHVPGEYSADLERLGGFSFYTGPDPRHRHTDVVIFLPREIDLFIAALRVVERTREGYPASDVWCACDEEFKHLLPPWAKWHNLNSPLSFSPYKSLDLRSNAALRGRIQNANITWSMSYEQILLHHSGLYDVATDAGLVPRWLKLGKTGKPSINIIGPVGITFAEAAPILDALRSTLPSVQELRSLDLKPPIVNTLNNSLLNVFLIDTPYHYVSAALHVPTLVVAPRAAIHTDAVVKRYTSIKYVYKLELPTYQDESGGTHFASRTYKNTWAGVPTADLADKIAAFARELAGLKPESNSTVILDSSKPASTQSAWDKIKEQGKNNVRHSEVPKAGS